jgi:hypothetical protein
VRTSVFSAVLILSLALTAVAQSSDVSQQALLDRGLAAYRAGDYAAAVTDLQAASHISAAEMQAYVNTGKLSSLATVEKALVYLALAQSKLGREVDARGTVLRLMTAEKIAPTYATLLIAEGAEFDALAARLVPGVPLPRNAAQPVQVAEGTPAPAPAPAPAATETAPAATPAEPEVPRVRVQQTIAEERAARQRIIDEIVAREREQIQREADARIAAERTKIEQSAAEKIAAERQAIEQSTAEKIAAVRSESEQQLAAARRDAEQRIVAAEREAEARLAAVRNESQSAIDAARSESQQQIAAIQRESEERLAEIRTENEQKIAAVQADAQRRITEAQAAAQRDAEARIAEAQREAEARVAAAQRQADERIAAERAAAAAQVAEAEANMRRGFLTSLRQADTLANNGDLAGASQLYARVASSEGAPREFITAAATGLYRTGAFREAASAFRRLGAFAKGEEDLRYYNAVALYEIGSYEDAKKELACALPFIQVNDDVARYRAKIEQTPSQQAMR